VVVAAVLGAGIGCGIAFLITRRLRVGLVGEGAAGGSALTLHVRVRSPDREEKATGIFRDRNAAAVRVRTYELEKRLEDLPLSSLRPDPWLGDERLGRPS
jgi:hypothetical protein